MECWLDRFLFFLSSALSVALIVCAIDERRGFIVQRGLTFSYCSNTLAIVRKIRNARSFNDFGSIINAAQSHLTAFNF